MQKREIKALPSSFVASNMKLASESGSGEAKLWVGQKSNSDELDQFFEFDSEYSYTFSKENMLEYMNQVKIEYVYQKFNNYKNASEITWNNNYKQIEELAEDSFKVKLSKFIDDTRYYIRAEDLIFKKIFRNIAVPKLTNLVFSKDENNKLITLLLELNLEYNNGKNAIAPYSQEWFREKAKDYPGLDSEALNLLDDFMDKFSPAKLNELSGIELLHTIFLNNENTENLCRTLEFAPKIKDIFGSIKGGSAYKFGLYFSTDGKWMSGTGRNPKELTEDEAIELGLKIRDCLIAGAKVIEKYTELETLEEYKTLYAELNTVTEGHINKSWFMKYYFMMFPKLFASDYSDVAQRTVLSAIGKNPEKYALVRMGQIKLYTDECGISNVMFNKIFWDNYTGDMVESKENSAITELRYETKCEDNGFSSNRIVFGAPGTGKSFTLNKEKDELLANGGDYERVTFHPDYSYANFVGTYKPVPKGDEIAYEYVPGPFMRVLVKALRSAMSDEPKPYLLIIEEINRANTAAVFGDVFQLLDRKDNISEYPIQTSEDMRKYLAKELHVFEDECAEIRIPDNMFIWATMNSADQGVYPMDTAFKRRWDFTYIGIDDGQNAVKDNNFKLRDDATEPMINWNALRVAINEVLVEECRVNEDKLMGPFFISKTVLDAGDDKFRAAFKNKVLMYLCDDVLNHRPNAALFNAIDGKPMTYAKLCKAFDEVGLDIFTNAVKTAPNVIVSNEG